MTGVLSRQWGPRTFAAYVDLGGRYPEFVAVEETEEEALETARRALRKCSGNRLVSTDSGGASADLERLSGGQLKVESDEPTCVNTPARLAPEAPGATP
jgi:hypothetical protein